MASMTNLTYGKVVGRFLALVGDGNDDDPNPDVLPLSGSITFTPTVKSVLVASAQPDPATILPARVVAVLDSEGYLTYRGERGVFLLANDDPNINPSGFTYAVAFQLNLGGVVVNYAGFSISVPQWFPPFGDEPDRTVVDLALVAPVASANGVAIIRGEPGLDGAPGIDGINGAPGADGMTSAQMLSQMQTNGTAIHDWLSGSFGAKADVDAKLSKTEAVSSFTRMRRPKITALGDSITAQNTAGVGAAGYLTLANTLLRQRFDYALDTVQNNFFGMSGKTAEQLITEGHAAAAAASDADGCIVMAGTNDIGTGRTPAQILTSLKAIWSMLLATGKYVVVGTITPRADTIGLSDLAAQAALIRETNRLIRTAAASTPGVYLCDWHAALVDPATGMMAAGYSREGLHPTTTGAGRLAAVLAPVLASITASTGDAALPVANGDGYFVNALEVGTTGTKTQGSSTINGQVASSWTLVAPTTGAVITASKVARTDLWPGEWQQIEPVTLAGVQDRTYYRQQTATLASLGLAVGDKVIMDIEFETDAAGWDLRHLEAVLDFPGAAGGSATALSLPTDYRTAQTLPMYRMPSGVLRTAVRTIPADSTAMRLTLNLYGKAIFRVGRIGIRKVT